MVRQQLPKRTKPQPDCIWDLLMGMGRSAARLGQLPGTLAPLIRNRDIIGQLQSPESVTVLAASIASDTARFAQELSAIFERHQNRTGSSKSPDDLMKALMIGEDYVNWSQRFQGIVLPGVIDILTQVIQIDPSYSNSLNQLQSEMEQVKASFILNPPS